VTDFLSAVGKQVARRWLALLALPGLLLIAAVAAGDTLGQNRSLDLRLLTHAGSELADRFQDRGVPALVAGVALAAAAAAVGVLARGAGTAIQAAWLMSRLPGTAGRLLARSTRAREQRWQDADRRYRDARRAHEDGRVLAELAARRNRIALAKPAHPTWMGDRLAAAGSRVYHQYGLDLQFAWPRLWLVLPELARTEIRDARDSFAAAATLQAWGVFYLALGIVWWPSAVCGAFAAVLGWRRGRAAVAALADLVESSFDLHHRDLAVALGFSLPSGGPAARAGDTADFASGAEINELIRKGS
jgi:hypothetical protein